MVSKIMHKQVACIALALAAVLPLCGQTAEEEEIALPDVTTVVSGDTLTAGKDSIPDYSTVLPTVESGRVELPRLEQAKPQAASPSPVAVASVAEKNVYAEGNIGGGYPFLFLGDFTIYRATGNAPFSIAFKHQSAENFADNKASDGFFTRTTAVSAEKSYTLEKATHRFAASYDTADYGLQSLSAPFFDMVNHTISVSEYSRFLVGQGWHIDVGGAGNWYNRYAGKQLGTDLHGVTARSTVVDLAPTFGFGWESEHFAAGFDATYQMQANADDASNFAEIDGSSYRNATHRGKFGVSAAVSTEHARFRGDVAIVAGTALGKPAVLAPFTVGTDLAIPLDADSDETVLLTAEGGLSSWQPALRQLEKDYRYAFLAALPTETTDWYGALSLSVPLLSWLSLDGGATFCKTAFENGVWTVDYDGERDASSGLYGLYQDDRTDFASRAGVAFDWHGCNFTASWCAHWMDVPALETRHAVVVTTVYQTKKDRLTAGASWNQALGANSDKVPELGAMAAIRVSPTIRIALEVNDVVKLLSNTTREFAHSDYKAESGSAAIVVKFQF